MTTICLPGQWETARNTRPLRRVIATQPSLLPALQAAPAVANASCPAEIVALARDGANRRDRTGERNVALAVPGMGQKLEPPWTAA